MNSREWFEFVERSIADDQPGFKLVYKDESLFHKMVGKLAFFNKEYMKTYVTTIGKTVAFPSRYSVSSNYEGAASVLFHEWAHLDDGWKLAMVYAFPQVLALLSLLSLLAVWFSSLWLLALLNLLWLAPLPAPGRVLMEKRGYTISVLCFIARTSRKKLSTHYRTHLHDIFSGREYYWMSRNTKDIDSWITKAEKLSADIIGCNRPVLAHRVEDNWLNHRVTQQVATLLLERKK